MQITVKTEISASLTQVWNLYTSPAHIIHWNAASPDWHTTSATVDLKVGGQFCYHMAAKDGSFGFDFAGTWTVVEPCTRLEYTFGERTASVLFRQQADVVVVTVTFEAETQHSIEQQQAGWQAILNNFARYVAANS
jgi:uncharacterized protein YndB with AHSA1/START domain